MKRRLLPNAVAVVVAAVTAFPIYWMVLSALKPTGEIESTHARPWTWHHTLDHFRQALGVSGFGRYFLNSVVVAVSVVLLASSCSAGWCPASAAR